MKFPAVFDTWRASSRAESAEEVSATGAEAMLCAALDEASAKDTVSFQAARAVKFSGAVGAAGDRYEAYLSRRVVEVSEQLQTLQAAIDEGRVTVILPQGRHCHVIKVLVSPKSETEGERSRHYALEIWDGELGAADGEKRLVLRGGQARLDGVAEEPGGTEDAYDKTRQNLPSDDFRLQITLREDDDGALSVEGVKRLTYEWEDFWGSGDLAPREERLTPHPDNGNIVTYYWGLCPEDSVMSDAEADALKAVKAPLLKLFDDFRWLAETAALGRELRD